MTRRHRIHLISAFALGTLMLAASAQAMDKGVTDKGIAYISGGAGETEQQALSEAKGAYTFWLTTAAKGTGAFMASVQVRIMDGRGQTLLDRATDGPWLLVALPPGSYNVEATSQANGGSPAQTKKAAFTTAAGTQKRLTLAFDQPQ